MGRPVVKEALYCSKTAFDSPATSTPNPSPTSPAECAATSENSKTSLAQSEDPNINLTSVACKYKEVVYEIKILI